MRRFVLYILVVFLPLQLAVAAEETKFLTHSLGEATYIDGNGMMRGKKHGGRRAFHVEVVVAMMHARDHLRPITEVPLARGFSLTEKEEGYAFFNVIQNAERRDRFKWVGPISDLKTVFYENSERPTGIKTVFDAQKVGSICTVRGSNMVKWFERHDFHNIVVANDYRACFQLLRYGRVDLIPTSEHPWFIADNTVRSTGVHTTGEHGFKEETDKGYIAFSKSTPDTEIALWQAALDQVKESGEFTRIRQNTLMPKSGN